MKTHMSNTLSQNLKNDIMAKTVFEKHRYALYSNTIKAQVVTRRKQQVKIVKNNKVQLNSNPNDHVNKLFRHLLEKKNVKSNINNKIPQCFQYSKTILKDKIQKNKHEKFVAAEHQKQLDRLQHRMLNCKSINQRKKDNFDPIVNPVYFMKNGTGVNQVSIEPYCKKILNKNRPKSAVATKSNTLYLTKTQNPMLNDKLEQSNYVSSVPDYSKANKQLKNTSVRPSTATKVQTRNNNKQISTDLPQPSFNGILTYLMKNKIYKDNDIKVLYVRLCYAYGEDNIDELWDQVMDELER